ncbi:hypothetical protein [Bacillus rhizoplanae]|uniref:hypothetical protein n=1 Tax=Bacillus rhizoplanae TaxID=2880966 RepID=UPI003D260748
MNTEKRLAHVEQQLAKIENLLSQRQHTKRKTIIIIILIILLLFFFLIVLGIASYALFETGDSSTTTIIQEKEMP